MEYSVAYTVINRRTNSNVYTPDNKVSETYDFDADDHKEAQMKARNWGGRLQFRGARWKKQLGGYIMRIYDGDYEIRLTLVML